LGPINTRILHRKEIESYEKQFPDFKSDAEAEAFVETADLSHYDFSDMKPLRFELRAKDTSISLRMRFLTRSKRNRLKI